MTQVSKAVDRIMRAHSDPVAALAPGLNPIAFHQLEGVGDNHVDFIQRFTNGNHFDLVRLDGGLDLWVDDEFLFSGKPMNAVASLLTRDFTSYPPIQILGGALLTGSDGPETVGLSEDQLRRFLTWFEGLTGPGRFRVS